MRLGIRAHDLGRFGAAELARRVARAGFTAVQLAPRKALVGWESQRADPVGCGAAREVAAAFARHGVEIAVVGCYINSIHPDEQTRESLLEHFVDHLRLAREFGCGLVALESGSVNADYSPHPANHQPPAFAALLASLSRLVNAAERLGVCVGLEAVTTHPVATPQAMQRVLAAIPSPNLRVVFDPVNLLSAATAGEQGQIVAESLKLFGDRIAVVHAKDFVVDAGAMKVVPAGQGELDYAPIIEFVRARGGEVPVLLEEVAPEGVAASGGFLRRKWEATL
jgi:sugar phosphate isomerase/epimerase